MSRIALVEDHDRLAALVRKALGGAGIEANTFGRADSAWPRCARRRTPR